VILPEEKWALAHIRDPDRGDLILRIDEAADTPPNVAAFPIRVGIAVPLSTAADFTIIDPLEHQIEEYLHTAAEGMLAAIISGTSPPYFREFIAYARDSFDLVALREVLATRLPHLEIQSYAEPDPSWHAFEALKSSYR
jgi:hypothetical protein